MQNDHDSLNYWYLGIKMTYQKFPNYSYWTVFKIDLNKHSVYNLNNFGYEHSRNDAWLHVPIALHIYTMLFTFALISSSK